jgi:hypothetical protein
MASSRPLLPLGLKILFTGFLAVMVPVYWYNYGPSRMNLADCRVQSLEFDTGFLGRELPVGGRS